MPRDNKCMYMAHVCFYVCCSDCVWVCGNVCCVVFFYPWSVCMLCVCVGDVMDVVFSVLYCEAWAYKSLIGTDMTYHFSVDVPLRI